MGFDHQYDLIKENYEDGEGADIKNEPRHSISPPRSTSWWKLLLCNLLAAAVGAGAMFLFLRGFDVRSSSGSTSASVATPTVSSADLAVPTPPIEHTEEEVDIPIAAAGNISMASKVLDCGYSPSEARAKGCVYDVMMQDWVPEPCYDSVLTERYLAQGNWTWYGDGDGNTTISDEEMRKGEHGAAWMSTSYHKEHCVFSWLKIIRALRNGRGISQELLSYDHVLHCAHGALRADSDDEGLGVRAPTNYAKCALYETWKLDFIPDKHNSTQRL